MATNKIEVVVSNQAGSGTIPPLIAHRDLSQYLGSINSNKNISATDLQLASAIAKEFAKAIPKFLLNSMVGGGRPNIIGQLESLSDRAFSNTGFTPRVDYEKNSTFTQTSWKSASLFRIEDMREAEFANNGRGLQGRSYYGNGFSFRNPTGILSDISNANRDNADIPTNYRYRVYDTLKTKKRTRAEEATWKRSQLMQHPSDAGNTFGYGFTFDKADSSSTTASFGGQKAITDERYINASFKNTDTISNTISNWINKIFRQAGFKIDQMMGKAGFFSQDKNGNDKWREGTGILGRYSNPRNRALMRSAMVGSTLSTAGDFAGNYGDYISNRANVTGSFAGNYYAGTANENYGNYLGGLVNARSKFLQSQVSTGVQGGTRLAGAALFAMFPAEGLLAKAAIGGGLGSASGGFSSWGAAEINKYLQLGGQAFQQKAINLGNASVASQYYAMSRWTTKPSDYTSKNAHYALVNAIPASMTMNNTDVNLPIIKSLANFQDDPFFNQLVTFMQNANIDPNDPAFTKDIRSNFTNLRKLGYTDTASMAKLGAMSNVYGAITGNYSGALTDLVNQSIAGQDAYGTNFNLDTLQSSVRFQTVLDDKKQAGSLAMRSQYFPEVAQKFNAAANSTFSEALSNNIIWNIAGFHGDYQRIMFGLDPMGDYNTNLMKKVSYDIGAHIGDGTFPSNEILPAQLIKDRSADLAVAASYKINKANAPGIIAAAKSAGDKAISSVFDDVMSTPNMTVNATNVTLNWGASGSDDNSPFGNKFSPNDQATNLGGMGISLPAPTVSHKPVVSAKTPVKSKKKLLR